MLLAMVLSLGCDGCHPSPQPVTPVGLDGPATCATVCANGVAHGCAFAQPTPLGASCVDVCLHNQDVGIAPWDLDCRTAAPSCARIDACR